MESALGFYRDLLGLQVAVDHVHDPSLLASLLGVDDADVRSVILRCADGTELELAEFRHPRGRATADKRVEDAGITFVTLMFEDLDEIVETLRLHDCPIAGEIMVHPFPAPVRVAYCKGPDGVNLTLAQFVPANDTNQRLNVLTLSQGSPQNQRTE
jgi:catechol 2,3-dioxygenase-like lactoylglutathione lyase family enzyme